MSAGKLRYKQTGVSLKDPSLLKYLLPNCLQGNKVRIFIGRSEKSQLYTRILLRTLKISSSYIYVSEEWIAAEWENTILTELVVVLTRG